MASPLIDVVEVIERQKVGRGQCLVVLLCALLMFLDGFDTHTNQLRQQNNLLKQLSDGISAFYSDLEQLEQRLTAIEEKMIARLRAAASDEALFEARRALDRELKPYRSKMTADQLALLEKQFLERKLLEASGLPRLSLFYLIP